MSAVRDSTYDLSGGKVVGDAIAAADAGVNFVSFGGSGTVTYEAAASGFSDPSTTVGRYVGAGVKIAGKTSIATWSAASMYGEYRAPLKPTGGVGVMLYASVGGVRMARVYMETDGSWSIDGTAGQGTVDTSVQDLAGGVVYNYLWQLDRALGEQILYLWNGSSMQVLVGECGNTTGTLDLEEGIAAASGVWTVELNDTHVDNTITAAPDLPAALVSGPRGTGPRVDGWSIKVETTGYTKVRAKVYTVEETGSIMRSTGDPFELDAFLFTTPDVTVPASGWSQIDVQDADELSPFTHYGAQLQGFDGADWVDIGLPTFAWTLPVEGEVLEQAKIACVGCEKDNQGAFRQAWDHICFVFKPHWVTQGGDEDYDNYTGLLASKFRQFTSNKLRATPGMADTYRLYCQFWRQLSDHDCGDANGGTASPAIEFSTLAWLETSGVEDLVVDLAGPIHERGRVGAFLVGRWQLLFGDFRTTARSDPMDVDSPAKFAVHEAQEDWYLDRLLTHDATGGATLEFSDPPVVGTAADQTDPDSGDPNKKDHWARYPDQRSRYDAVRAAVRATGVFFDYHGGAATHRDVNGLQTWFCCNGTANDSGNVRLPDEHNYEQLFAQESTTPDGERIQLYTQVILGDDGTNLTAQLYGIDARAGGTTVMDMLDVHGPEDVPYVPPPAHEVITVDGVSIHEPGGPWKLAPGTRLGILPAKSVASSRSRGLDGEVESDDIDAGPVDLAWPTWVYGTDYEDRERNVAALMGLWGRKKLRDVQWAKQVGRSPVWRCWARQDASVPEVREGNRTRLDLMPHNPDGRWRTVVPSTTTIMLDELGFGGTKELVELRTSRAPIDDAILRFTGPMKFCDVSDGRTSNGFHWGIPDVDPSLPAGSFLIVRTKDWECWVVDHDTWDWTEGGVLHNENRFHRGTGASLLTLTPDIVAGNPYQQSIRLHCDIEGGLDGVTMLEILAYGATYKPVGTGF